MNPCLYVQLIYDKAGKSIQWGKGSLQYCWEIGQTHTKKWKWITFLHHIQDSKWIKDLNVRPKTIKLIKENTGSKLFDITLNNAFLGMPFIYTKEYINKWDYIKLKCLLNNEGNHQQNEKNEGRYSPMIHW